VFQVDANVNASISGLTITGGTAGSAKGGGVNNYGSLTMASCTVSGNSATKGGGLYNNATLALTDCTLSDNSATSSSIGGGGGLSNFSANATATLTDCVISGNSAGTHNNGGGGLYNAGSLALTGCTVSDNSGSQGGGVLNYALSSNTQSVTLVMDNCTVSGNSAGNGGGVYNLGYGTAMLTDCTVSGNTASDTFGGGVSNLIGTLSLANCIISDNQAPRGGGVINNGTATVTNCTFSGNTTIAGGGGFYEQYGPAALTDCTVSGNTANYGGGLADNSVVGNYTLTLTDCSIINNYASYEGGGIAIFQRSVVSMANCIVSGNTAGKLGGGVLNDNSTAALTNCTVSGNSANQGGGLDNYAGTTTPTLANTIVAGNKAATSPDVFGGVTSLGNNLIGATDGSSGWVGSDLTGTSALPLEPLLAPLGNYGGPTQTMPLLPGSLAIDAGNNALAVDGNGNPLTTDQRGLPRIVNATVDIGAFESSGFTIAVTSGSGQSTVVSTAFSDSLIVTVTANNPIEPVAGGQIEFTPPASGASAILSASSAAISADGTASVTATANSTLGSYNVSATASGITTPASFSLTNQLLSTFSDLTSPTIVYGTPTTTLTGHIGSGTTYPTGSSVSITLDSVTQTATVDASGNFSITFTTASLGVAGSPYPVTYVFAGNATFTIATDSSTTLTVTPATATVVVTPYTVTYDGSPHTATITSITGVNGETGATVGTVTLNTTHTNAGTYSTDSWSFTGSANYSDIASTTITDTITPAPLTITANDDSKTYGTVKTFGTTAFTETGLATANGDTITGVSETST
jgi:hypothetical protein